MLPRTILNLIQSMHSHNLWRFCFGLLLCQSGFARASGPTMFDIRMELARHEFTPHYLTMSGISTTSTSVVVQNAIEQINDHWTNVDSTRGAVDSLKAQSAPLERLIRSGQASNEQVASYNTLLSQLDTAQSAYTSAYTSLDQALLDTLSSEQQEYFVTIRSNGERKVDLKYRALVLSDSNWAALRGALSTIDSYEDIAQEGDNPPPAAATQIVQQYQSNYLVNLMQARLDMNLSGVTSSYETTLANLP